MSKSNKQAKNFTLEIAKYFKAKIPNNYFDTIQLITSASDLIFDKPEIIDWTNEEVVSWINHLGLDKYSYSFYEHKINGVQFIKCNVLDFKNKFKINDLKDLKLLLKSVDFLRIFIKLKKDYQNFLDLEKDIIEDSKKNKVSTSSKQLTKINEITNENDGLLNDAGRVLNNNTNIGANMNGNEENNKTEQLNISSNKSKKQTENHSDKNHEIDTSNKDITVDNTYINDNQAFNITKNSLSKLLFIKS
jgi:hypothetical protein